MQYDDDPKWFILDGVVATDMFMKIRRVGVGSDPSPLLSPLSTPGSSGLTTINR